MTPVQRTLLAIFALVAIALGSFIWFIANWDKSKTNSIGALSGHGVNTASLFSDLKNPGGLGAGPQSCTHYKQGA